MIIIEICLSGGFKTSYSASNNAINVAIIHVNLQHVFKLDLHYNNWETAL